MKSLWIVNHYAGRGDDAIPARHFLLAKYLADHGFTARIFASAIEHNTNQDRSRGLKSEAVAETPVTFEWISSPKLYSFPGGRLATMVVFALMSYWRMVRMGSKPDVIIGSTVHPFAALAAELAARWYRVPFIYEVRDIWPLSAIAFGRAREGSLSTRLIDRLDRYLCRRAVKILSVLPNYADFCRDSGRAADKVEILPNGVDLQAYEATRPTGDGLTLMHVGSMGQANALEDIFNGLLALGKERIPDGLRVEFVGSGPLRQYYQDWVRERGVDFVFFLEPMPKPQLIEHMAGADGFLLSIASLPQLYRYGVAMNKMSDYLAMGRPILLITDLADTHAQNAGAALTVQPGDSEGFVGKLRALAEMTSAERNRLGSKARRYAEQQLDYKQLAQHLADILAGVIANRR